MRYQYSSQGFRRNLKSNQFSFPWGVKILLIINIIVFVLMELSGQKNVLFQIFGLVPHAVLSEYKLWQTCTYLFVHGGYLHILFNMFVLWIFGKDLEKDWGGKEFLIFYFLCGMGAGFFTVLISMNSFIPIVGASGAIYGLLAAYGFSYPNRVVYLYGIFPLQVKYMVLGLGAIAFIASLSAERSNVSHITHLSGMIIGIIYIILNLKWRNIQIWYLRSRLNPIKKTQDSEKNTDAQMKIEVNQILDKLNNEGWESLTTQEEVFLKNASKHLFKNDSSPKPN